ncbi:MULTISPECIES: hypothetical protein [unclassified Modestobacter]|uniref:hypothetical protein n=1 Tax=unclassified Modestobacter TaxID=2643866 RepID=UPI0022AA4640|nr:MULTISPECIES: hypothetical protein [unclassified Modestobacter]MCZ2822941.1 hypothetical protein [Modestobacter sp. VKM Ac-2981]MCZ2851187.1 hypothetical protein [Modestobacter sp. VKM Ac-2982]
MTPGRGWFLGAAALALASLGLPWAGQLSGAGHPARVAVLAALALAVMGLRRGEDRWLTAALAAAGVGLLLGGLDASSGRMALAGAAVCLVLGCRAAGHRLVPARGPAG